jgi:hypothetical protein
VEEITGTVYGEAAEVQGADEGRWSNRFGRRAMVLGAAAGAAAAIGAVAASASPAGAADGNSVLLGQPNAAEATTSVSTTYGDGLMASTTQNGQNGLEGEDLSPKGGQGVRGKSTAGYGVYGISDSGVGVYAQSKSSSALEVEGRATFSRSGILKILPGTHLGTQTGVPLTATSIVLATTQEVNPACYVIGVAKNVEDGEFTIWLSANVPHGKFAYVGWFVVN